MKRPTNLMHSYLDRIARGDRILAGGVVQRFNLGTTGIKGPPTKHRFVWETGGVAHEHVVDGLIRRGLLDDPYQV